MLVARVQNLGREKPNYYSVETVDYQDEFYVTNSCCHEDREELS